MEECIHKGFSFYNSHFLGGASVADVNRMRKDAKKETITRKTTKNNVNPTRSDAINAEYVVSLLKSSVSADLCWMEKEIKNLVQALTEYQSQMRSDIQVMFETFQRNIVNSTPTHCTGTPANTPHVPKQLMSIARTSQLQSPALWIHIASFRAP